MLKIGLTGSIGAGKSTVAKIIEEKGIPVFYGDTAGREAEKDPAIRKAFIKIIGEDVLVNGEIDRAKMRAKVFNNKDILAQVNELFEPFILNMFNEFLEKARSEGKPVVFMESAILFESNAAKGFDYIVSVIADQETRFKRVVERDKIAMDLIIAKMNVQTTDEFKVKNSDFIIMNNDVKGFNPDVLLEKQVRLLLLAIIN